MANCERISPLLACPRGVLTSLPADAASSRDPVEEAFSVGLRAPPPSAFDVIALKGSLGTSTQSYVTGVGYMAWRGEYKSFSVRDLSSYARFVPIRNDPEMVVNLGLGVAEAGLRRLGVEV